MQLASCPHICWLVFVSVRVRDHPLSSKPLINPVPNPWPLHAILYQLASLQETHLPKYSGSSLSCDMDLESNVVGAISEANSGGGDGKKLRSALVLCGVLVAASALGVMVHKPPSGIFLNHGKLIFYSYYVILVLLLLFGLAEAWVGYGASSCDMDEGWRATAGRKLLWFSVLAAVLLVGLGGSSAFAITR